jgi:hypothetical protein
MTEPKSKRRKTMENTASQRIAALNDQFRQGGMNSRIPGRMFATAGVSALPVEVQLLAWHRVASFNTFTPDNDPYGEHDFGSFGISGERFFWKIDYYADAAMDSGSEDPADPGQCFRVLAVMLASEY